MSTPEYANRAGITGTDGSGRALPPPFTPPLRSSAARRIVVPQKGSLRGALVTRDDKPRIVSYESNIERRVLLVLLARPDVIEVREQVEAVDYVDEDGVERKHWFDFLVTRRDGGKILVAVKDSKWVGRHPEFERNLPLIAARVPRTLADHVVLMTELDATRDRVHDARLIHSARADRRPEQDRSVRELVDSLVGTTTIGNLVAASKLEGRGFRAVVRLIAQGVLRTVGFGRIRYKTQVVLASHEGGRP